MVLLFAGVFAAPGLVSGQAPANPQQQNQQKPASKSPTESNPFPEDTSNVPVLPNATTTAAPNAPSSMGPPPALPANDADPVRSPDDPVGDESTPSSSGFSSSSAGLDKLTPPPDVPDDRPRKGAHNQQSSSLHQESAKQDESVGSYYLSEKNWRAALSRFESAVVLDPENPDVYWGLAESQRHLGDLAKAKANYQKVMEYDPDSKHAKDAKKLLQEPELANATAAAVPHARE